jgi:hypothetical protein
MMRRPGQRRAIAMLAALVGLPLVGLAPWRDAGADAAPTRPSFSHEGHGTRGVKIDACAACHQLAPDGRAAPPTSANPHQPCATSGCHEDQFFSRTPTLCAVCHEGADPSKKLVARYAPRGRSEFGGQISHASHAGAKVAGSGGENGACVACHGDLFRKQAPPAGHAVCAPCHGASEGGAPATAQPVMASCGGCHKRGAEAAAAMPRRSPWAVGARFDHATHGSDPTAGGGETRCVKCHATVPKARETGQIVAPTMQSCDGCHDGTRAFKTTGFECKKCHAPVKR